VLGPMTVPPPYASLPIEDYAFIGDLHTGALVGRNGSVDWLCLPRFDSAACFAALLGTPDNGRWMLAPAAAYTSTRRYVGDSLVLETTFTTETGVVRVTDAMPVRDEIPDLIRRVEGVSGTVDMFAEVTLRFDYGAVWPRLIRDGRRVTAIAGPDTVIIDSDVELDCAADSTARAAFRVSAGDSVSFRLGWTGPRAKFAAAEDVPRKIHETVLWWNRWAARCQYTGPDRGAVLRSLVTLKGLTYAPSGGIVAALTTSLPEQLGGVRNWDYRYCWIRDATYTLLVLLEAGFTDEARRWREWLVRTLAGRPDQMQIMYGVDGERRLTETQLGWLPGYQGAAPVRIGNGAAGQLQLDVYGELEDAMYQARLGGIAPDDDVWHVERTLMDFLESIWQQPDEGIWEVRGARRHFTHSKVMAWVAMDRAIKTVEKFGLPGPLDRWRATRDAIHRQVCTQGFDPRRDTFTQSYGSAELDASLLLIAPVGFLPATDARVRGTVAAIEKHLLADGFVRRYDNSAGSDVDGLPPGEGAFLACTFWLADNYCLLGRTDEARTLFDRLLSLRNDVGLLAEEYDIATGRLVGNFPQAFSHLQLINSAVTLAANGDMTSPMTTRATS
jgi:GH15 family glucan-1,4-alpha-glucosidase